MTMPYVGALFGTIAGVMAIMLHSSIHKIEEGHLAVYYRYHNVPQRNDTKNVYGLLLFVVLFPDKDKY